MTAQVAPKVYHRSIRDDWETPKWLFDELDREFGPFSLDVFAEPHNAKCARFIDPKTNALTPGIPWGPPGTRAYYNPPYGPKIYHILKTARAQADDGRLLVGLLKSTTDTKWFHDFVWDAVSDRPRERTLWRPLKGRVVFEGAESPAPFPSAVVVFFPPDWGPGWR